MQDTSAAFLQAIQLERGAIWPCGHERTPENSQRVGKAGVRCRMCRRQVARNWYRRHRDELRLQVLPGLIEIAEHRLAMLRREQQRLSK